jgi:hypothetical protein
LVSSNFSSHYVLLYLFSCCPCDTNR